MTILPANPPISQAPHIPTGQELYDMIMGNIEPELTTEGLKTLVLKYANETEEEKYERKKRYDIAFDRYAQAYEGYIGTLQAQMERYRKQSFQHVELTDRTREEGLLESLTQTMFQQAA